MTTEEANVLTQIRDRTGTMALVSLSRRQRAVAQRIAANSAHLRIIGDNAFLLDAGRTALNAFHPAKKRAGAK